MLYLAPVCAGDLLAPLFKQLSESLLAKIAMEAGFAHFRLWNLSIGYAAIKQLSDQSFLAKIAMEAGDLSVRTAAVAKLSDQSLLAKIAMEDRDASVRQAAKMKLGEIEK